jgi:glycosyltransferase involved in cell wall biosynthesis
VNGFLCRPRHPEDLADKMEAMITMPSHRLAEMGSASRAFMKERFDETFVIDAYLAAVDRLAGRG